jgi:CspA family cold shock protein
MHTMSESVRYNGTVKWFNIGKGYGFIERDDDTKDVLVHHTAINSKDRYKRLANGDRVEFGIRESDDGPHAVGVIKI